jgi:hypothetical protein
MDRSLDPVYIEAREACEVVLSRAGYSLLHEEHSPAAFGSASAEYRHRLSRVRLVWDGKDRFLGLAVAETGAPNQFPAPGSWRPLEPTSPRAPPQSLRPGPAATERIADLRAALAQFIEAAA